MGILVSLEKSTLDLHISVLYCIEVVVGQATRARRWIVLVTRHHSIPILFVSLCLAFLFVDLALLTSAVTETTGEGTRSFLITTPTVEIVISRMRLGFRSGGTLKCRIDGRRFLAIATTTTALVVVFLISFYSVAIAPGIYWPPQQETTEMTVQQESQRGAVSSQRKLLSHGMTPANRSIPSLDTSSVSTQRVGDGCTKDDIVIHQGATTPLPNGIPTYTVQVLNVCAERTDVGCELGQIHLSCGWFSSARLVNPRVFRRLRYDDCLVNDGRPFPSGSSLSFQYANSFPYQLSVSSASCVSR